MQEFQVGIGVIVAVGCFIATALGILSACVFARKNDTAENMAVAARIGTVLSIIITVPFFVSLCYLLFCIMGKIGKSI